MNTDPLFNKSVQWINKKGFLLVFPQGNKDRPQSLWSLLYPHSPLRWEWNEYADDRVVKLWHVREQLARSKEVVYGKFYGGRATFFSRDVFKNLLAILQPWTNSPSNLVSRECLDSLEIDSPLSTKQLRSLTGMKGRLLEGAFKKAMQELWSRLLIVGLGEIDDGAFPSLAHGATRTVFEDLWMEAQEIDPIEALLRLLELEDYEALENKIIKDIDAQRK